MLTIGYVGSLMVRGELEGVEERLVHVERWHTFERLGQGSQVQILSAGQNTLRGRSGNIQGGP